MIIEKYDLFETIIHDTNSAALVVYCAVFTNGNTQIQVPAFKIADDRSMVRFMPQETGIWNYQICICGNDILGSFECVENKGCNHGLVVAQKDYFRYADGATYVPMGTTSYAWIHQTDELQQQTLNTLAQAPFNKIRMCVFPKSMPYNNNDPEVYPFLKKADGSWDVSRPDERFWSKLDERIRQLMVLSIEVDLIVFHPYDRWGFAALSQEDSLTYLEYCIARLSAFRNLWWSLANEYEMLFAKSIEDWDAYGEMLKEKDIYGHLISIHNIITPYPKRDWMTHCSIQSKEINRIMAWKQSYGLPVIIDECGYEGDLAFEWGSLTAFEMVHRFWWTVCRGGFCTHGETYHREDEVLWWAKGGKLYGESAPRIGFLKDLLYQLPGPWKSMSMNAKDPNQGDMADAMEEHERLFCQVLDRASKEDREAFVANVSPMRIDGENFYLQYFDRIRPVYAELHLKSDKRYQVEVIDIWEMTRCLVADGVCGQVKIELPGKEGIAVLVTEI